LSVRSSLSRLGFLMATERLMIVSMSSLRLRKPSMLMRAFSAFSLLRMWRRVSLSTLTSRALFQRRARSVAEVPAMAMSRMSAALTVEQNIAFGLKARGVYKGHEDEVRSYIERMGLRGFEDALPLRLSGGMAQRVALARALVNHPKVLLLDEPLGALDSFTRRAMQDELIGLWESEHVTMIMVTHDVDEAIHMSSQVVVMSPRPCEVVEVVDNPLRKTYEGDSPEFIEMRRHIRSLLEEGESH
jgi:ABC-type nitrate/sulfonate/bicarbonate transport system ATPase subunit